ncbi:ribonuclease P protein component [Terrimonas sp.]|uniref:ribonuclease P protein component n=1 Tax=Terrimonas sp. TaxID=1914338 RepID=UPI000D51E5EE|nr:ribonuclease P protein component [Terrimonas sp.]PVD49522.1 ribonuclease P protein component [Terrimonas sp.]
MAKKFTLKKTERLKSRKSIERLFNAGDNFFIHPFKVYYTVEPGNDALLLQMGVAVSTRNFKKAVDRNRIKRITREAYRLQKNTLQQLLINKQKHLNVFFVFVGKESPSFVQIHEKLSLILERLIQKMDEKNTPNT